MKIEKLRLKGFIGILKGTGLPEIEIDFTGRDGLIAFAGDNGRGKTVCLESLAPFNQLISRDGALSHHCYMRDSERELTFSYNGDRYRTLLKIDAQSGKSEGFIWRNGESLINGKIRDYAKKINEIFGSENLFFNSVFCSQNATKLSDMRTGELKELFAEFLRLDRLQGYEETSKQKINVLIGKADQININIAALQKRLSGAQDLQKEIDRLTALKTEQETSKTELFEKLEQLQKERESLKEVIAKNEVLTAQVSEMTATLDGMENNLKLESSENESSLAKLRTQYKEINDEITRINDILKDEAEIVAAVENEKKLKELIDNITESLDTATNETGEAQDKVNRVEKEIQELKNKVVLPQNDPEYNDLKFSLMSCEQKIKACEAQLKTLDIRDPECQSKTCSFIVAALEAEKELPGLKEKYRQSEAAKNQRANELMNNTAAVGKQIEAKEANLRKAKAELIKNQELVNLNRKQLATERLNLNRYQNLAAKQSDIAVAKSKLEDRVKALGENKLQGTAISEAWKEKKEKLELQIEEQKGKREAVIESIDTLAIHTLSVAEKRITQLDQDWQALESTISETIKQIAAKQGELSGISEAEAQLKQARDEKASVSGDISDWTYLRNACGKNGLQAMEIDGAAPIITGFANDLLSQAFGSLYTVKFQTQDENGKECLDIITITDDGEEVLLDNLSGGQRVWVLMALRLAMTLLSKEKGGRNFQTAFFDEMDGALDSDNAVNFVNLYKSFMKIGHFSTIPFISHKPECRSMADHVLMFEKGKNPYWN